MHRSARLKTHALHRMMERFPGICPGVAFRCIDADTDPLAVIDGEAIHRVTLPDGRSLVAVKIIATEIYITVMTTPARVFAGNRVYVVTDNTIERIRNELDPFRHNRRRFKRAKQKARQRLL